jgi:hypothetical protein
LHSNNSISNISQENKQLAGLEVHSKETMLHAPAQHASVLQAAVLQHSRHKDAQRCMFVNAPAATHAIRDWRLTPYPRIATPLPAMAALRALHWLLLLLLRRLTAGGHMAPPPAGLPLLLDPLSLRPLAMLLLVLLPRSSAPSPPHPGGPAGTSS